MRIVARQQGPGGAAAGEDRRAYLGSGHPLAAVAGRHCREHLGAGRFRALGQVACGACWERAIRDDERFAVEFDLPREIVADPDFVDEIAVERACRGERVTLTAVERAEAVRRLRAAGVVSIRRLLRINTNTLRTLVADDAGSAVA